jgi:hypothetical protein
MAMLIAYDSTHRACGHMVTRTDMNKHRSEDTETRSHLDQKVTKTQKEPKTK